MLAFLLLLSFRLYTDIKTGKNALAKRRASLLGDQSICVKAYEGHMVISVWKDGVEDSSWTTRYEDIEAVHEMRDFYMVVHKHQL
jgi:hypothetical protein